MIELKGAKSLASCPGGLSPENPIITAAETGIASLGDAPAEVELARRRTVKTDFLFALNHTAEEKALTVPAEWKSLVGGPVLGPYGYSVFAVER